MNAAPHRHSISDRESRVDQQYSRDTSHATSVTKSPGEKKRLSFRMAFFGELTIDGNFAPRHPENPSTTTNHGGSIKA